MNGLQFSDSAGCLMQTELVGISSDGSQRAGGKPPAALTGALLHARSRSRFGPDFSAIHTATNVISRSHSRQSSMESISNAQIQSTTPAGARGH